MAILTDVHETTQVPAASQVADVLQIPAFLCRQTDLLVAAGRAGRAVNVKKGQWLSPDGMQGAVEKVRAGGAPEVAVTERGTFFGYGDLVVDMRNFARLRAACGVPVVYDATHSVQQPGQGSDGSSGGLREFVPPLLYAAAAAGADGFFLETHPDPDHAPSDGPNMVLLDQLPGIVSVALDVWQRARNGRTGGRADGRTGGQAVRRSDVNGRGRSPIGRPGGPMSTGEVAPRRDRPRGGAGRLSGASPGGERPRPSGGATPPVEDRP